MNGDNAVDDPWGFGTATEYPVLRRDFDGDGDVDADDIDPQRLVASPPSGTPASTVTYDTDGDGLIEIRSLPQLNAIRWDLDGDGEPDDPANAYSYAAAFPDAVPGMGCPTTVEDDDDNDCTGYELAADLDFDTDGDGAVNWSEEYWYSGAGWAPIGSSGAGNEFTATFEGNDHTITRLYTMRNSGRIGLFGVVGDGGRVRNLGLVDVDVNGSGLGISVGALAGRNAGIITACYATGSVTSTGTGRSNVGGLVGRNDHHVTGSSGRNLVSARSSSPAMRTFR